MKIVSQALSEVTHSCVDVSAQGFDKAVDRIVLGALEWNSGVKSNDIFLEWIPFVIPPGAPFHLPFMELDESAWVPSGAPPSPVWGLSMGIQTSQVQEDGNVEFHTQLKAKVVTAGFALAPAN